MKKLYGMFAVIALGALTMILHGQGAAGNGQTYHGLRIVQAQEAAHIEGGLAVVCPGQVCDDIATLPCASFFGTDACQGVTCNYFDQTTQAGNVTIRVQRCEVSFNQYVCEDLKEKNYQCTQEHASSGDTCTMDEFDSRCGTQNENDCNAPAELPGGGEGCPNGCFSELAPGLFCGEGCFPFLL